jgi:transcriptional regulator with XRE-family HTH domain
MRKSTNPKQSIELKENAEEAILNCFGKNLKELREKRNLSQESMAFIAGLSRSYYAEVESGKRNVSLINITKISVALDVELNKLLALAELKKSFK